MIGLGIIMRKRVKKSKEHLEVINTLKAQGQSGGRRTHDGSHESNGPMDLIIHPLGNFFVYITYFLYI